MAVRRVREGKTQGFAEGVVGMMEDSEEKDGLG